MSNDGKFEEMDCKAKLYDERIKTMLHSDVCAKTFWQSFEPEIEFSNEDFEKRVASYFLSFTGAKRPLDQKVIAIASQKVHFLAKRNDISLEKKRVTMKAFRLWWDLLYKYILRVIIQTKNMWNSGFIMGFHLTN
mmetsp:Transcript_16184/g.22598  ORF Transcript_16184/g.22598 Transcript_16184/m.22598 type:complete len:135 (+) Transcript_16184:748-1152(+)